MAADGKPFAAFAVCRRFWRNNFKTVRKLGEKQGGQYVDGIHFEYPGGQIRSLLSLAGYFGSGAHRDRYMGLRIPTTNVQPEQLEQTRKFALDTPGLIRQPSVARHLIRLAPTTTEGREALIAG
jgi:hypothetical protein